jgi:hypothetical protein
VLALRAIVWTLGVFLLGDGPAITSRAVTYGLVFAASLTSAIGLLLLQRWARSLALAVSSCYAALLVAGLVFGWASGGIAVIDLGRALVVLLEAAVVAGAVWFYLTRSDVLSVFREPAD